MYRVRSTDVWHNAPGIVAAYQPVAAPGPLLARYNQAHGGSNSYKAVDGTAPEWSPFVGWSGDARYLATGIVPASGWTVLIRFAGTPNNGALFGIEDINRWNIFPSYSGTAYFRAGGEMTATGKTSGVVGMAGQQAYHNGSAYGSAIPSGSIGSFAVFLMALNSSGTVSHHSVGWTFQAGAIYGRTLSPAEVWQASRQMAYCHVNPDWSAWGRRRRYFYAPSAAAGTLWRGVGRNSSPVGGSPGIGRTP